MNIRAGLRLMALSAIAALCAAPTLAQELITPIYAGSASFGASAFQLPGFSTGVFGHTASGNLSGISLGGTFGAQVGRVGNWDLLIGVNAIGAFGSGGTQTWTDTFTAGSSAVKINGLTTPAPPASIDLNHGVSTAISTINGPGGAAAATAAAGGTNNVAAVTPDGTGFLLSAVTTGATTGAAYAGIGSSSGGIFIAAGDIDGLAVTTTAQRSFAYWGADLTIGLQGALNESASLQVYAGPSFRQLTQGLVTTIDINIPEVLPSVLTHPTYRISIADTLVASYFGGVAGANLSVPLADQGIIFTLGAEGGVYAAIANWTGQDTYSTCCGSIGTPLATPSPTVSVNGPLQMATLGSTTAFAVRGSGALTFLIDESTSVTLGGNVEYLSAVPVLNRTGLTQTGAPEDWTAPGAGATTALGWTSMVNYGVSATFSVRF